MTDPHAAQARIARAADPKATIGCGLLVGRRHVLTCAHVVAAALGDPALAERPEAPEGEIPLDLPLLPRAFRTRARVIHWQRLRDDAAQVPEDIAVLELADPAPPEAAPAPLRDLAPADYLDLPVHCFGFPARVDEGVPRTGTCRGQNALGRVHLDIERGLVEGGFSGTGAWEVGEGAVVGLVVAARTDDRSAQLIPARTLLAAWPDLDPLARPRNPYKSLRAFQPADEPDFFGRSEAAADLTRRVGRARLTTLIGPSGSGKSSLIGAGLIPALAQVQADAGGWTIVRMRPGADPFDELAGALIPAGLTLGQRAEERQRLLGLLAQDEGPAAVFKELLASESETGRILLICDQLEELFTNAEPRDPARARRFAEALAALAAAEAPIHLLLGMRADFMGRAMDGPAAAFVAPELQFQLGPLADQDLRAAIEGPAEAQGVRFAAGLVDAMLAELEDQPGRLPLLQFALTELWDHQRARTIGPEALDAVGGVRQALSDYADRVVDALTDAERRRARRILVQLVRPGEREDEAATRQVATQDRIPAADLDLLPRLAGSRLVVTAVGPGGEPIAEIAHEALIREWRTLRDWVAEDRALRLWQEGLRSRIKDWEDHARDPGFLLSGPPLAEAGGRLAASPEWLSEPDKAFILASSRRESRRRWVLRGVVVSVIAVLAVLGGLAAWQWQRALASEREAVAAAEQAKAAKTRAQAEAERAEKAAARASRARSSAEDLIQFMTFDLRRKLEPLGRLELLRDAQQRVDAYYELLGVLEDDPAVMRRRAVNLFNSGDLQLALGDLGAAERLYGEGAEILGALAEAEPEATDRQRDLSVSLERIGDIRVAQGDLDGALAAYEEDLAIAERLADADPSNARWQRDLSVSQERIGAIRSAQGDLAGALAAFDESRRIRERLADADPSNAGWQRDLSVSLNKIGDIRAAQGDLDGALAAFEESRAIAERLAESDPSNAGWQRDLSVSLNKIGDIRSAQGDLDGALAAFEESRRIRERLADADPSNAGWQRDLSVSLNKIGDIRTAQGDLDGALAAFEEGLAIAERLAEADPSNAGWQADLMISLVKLSELDLVERPTAREYLTRALEIAERLESAGSLHADQRGWPAEIRRRLEALAGD